MSGAPLRETVRPPRWVWWRVGAALFRQEARTARCPPTPRLDGAVAVVTGGNAGVGFETALGLGQRGAHVVIAARRRAEGLAAAERITAQCGSHASFVPLDLADLTSANSLAQGLGAVTRGRTVDVFVANAGLWPQRPDRSPQGHELAFATNVLGHHAAVRSLQRAGMLDRGRVVVVTGDLYVMAHEVTPDFEFEGLAGGRDAYCRSKLGNVWWAQELERRFPDLEVVTVHPGVVASGLGGAVGRTVAAVRARLLLSAEQGAQTSLWAATQPGVAGAYLHNTLGRVRLRDDDPAMNPDAAAALWQRLEQLARLE